MKEKSLVEHVRELASRRGTFPPDSKPEFVIAIGRETGLVFRWEGRMSPEDAVVATMMCIKTLLGACGDGLYSQAKQGGLALTRADCVHKMAKCISAGLPLAVEEAMKPKTDQIESTTTIRRVDP